MKRILAFDLGATKTGWAHNVGDVLCGTWELMSQAEMKPLRSLGMDRFQDPRIPSFFKRVVGLGRTLQPELIVFEDVLFAKSLAQGQLWASLRGALWCASSVLDVPVRCVPIQTIKKHATGHGGASKGAMVAAAGRKVDDDNAADALALLKFAISVELGENTYTTASIKKAAVVREPKRRPPEGYGAVDGHLGRAPGRPAVRS